MPMKTLTQYLLAERGRQARLAEDIGVSPSYISDVSKGKKPGTLKLFRSIASATGLPLAELLGEHEYENDDDTPILHGLGEPDATPFVAKQGTPAADAMLIARTLAPDASHIVLYTAQRDFPGFAILKGDLLIIGTASQSKNGDVVIANISDGSQHNATTVLRQRFGDQLVRPLSGALQNEERLSVGIFGTLIAAIRSPIFF
ncbi:hypothetical protein [Nostoc phage Nsp-JY21]